MLNGIKILFLVLLLMLSSNTFSSYDVNPDLEKKYKQIVVKLDKKYNSDSKKEIFILLNTKISKILSKKGLKQEERKLIKDLSKLINESLYELHLENSSYSTNQKILEKQFINNFEKELIIVEVPDFVKEFINNDRKLITVNNNYEFIDGASIKRLLFKQYYELSSSANKGLEGKKGFIVNISGKTEYIFVSDYQIENKIPYSEANKYFKFSSSDNSQIFQNTSSFYTYNVPDFLFIEDKYGFYLSSLESAGIVPKNYGIHRNNSGKYTFIKNYKKIDLINKEIVFGIADKEKFLDNIKNDKKIFIEDTNEEFSELKEITYELTSGLSRTEKIKVIYEWILTNINYSTDFSLEDYEIYSGILTYKNKDGVCEGYVKLMAYMLNFAGITDVEVMRGRVFDVNDFPQVGHAWLKIGDLYYDPTFDDPIGALKNREYSEFKYFALPRDLFYTNRYDLNYTPKELLNTDLEYRKTLVASNLSKLVEKYKDNNYILLNESIFKKENGIKADEKITVNSLIDALTVYDVRNNSFTQNGVTKNISNISFFDINDDNISIVLSQLNYNMKNRYIFKWINNDGTYEYIITNTVTIK